MTTERVNAEIKRLFDPSVVGLTIIGATSQSADLQQWQNSSGSVIARIYNNGVFNAQAATLSGSIAAYGGGTIVASGAAAVGLIVKGVASHTANLQEWQNSAGTVLANIRPSGGLDLRPVNFSGNVSGGITFTDNGNNWTVGSLMIKSDASGNPRLGFQAPQSAVESLTIYNNSVGVRTVAPASTLHVSTGAAANVGLIVQAASSQSANIQEWQDSAGTVLARVTSAGNLSVGTTNGVIQVTASSTSPTYPSSGSGLEFVAGSSVDTDLIQAYNRGTSAWRTLGLSAQAFRFKAATVELLTITSTSVGINNTNPSGSVLALGTGAAGNVGAVIRGAASQTANLQEWQDSTGTVRARVSSGGDIYSGAFISNWASYFYAGTAAIVPLTVKGAASQTANLQIWQDSTDAVLASISPQGQFRISSVWAISSYNNAQVNMLSTGTQITTNVASNVTLSVKGAASQSTELQQWQDSTGTALAYVSASGSITAAALTIPGGGLVRSRYFVDVANTGAYLDLSSGSVGVLNRTTVSAVPLIVAGMASQTGDLQQWRNSAGTTLARVNPSGSFVTSGVVLAGAQSGSIGYITAICATATDIGIGVKGAASQTADLTQWQNNSGTVLASMSASGAFSAITKSFDIPHPTKPNMRLRYGSLEGPENGVYVRGRSKSRTIELPEHWLGLVDPDTITVTLTPIGKPARLYVKNIENNTVTVGGGLGSVEFFYTVFAERKDVDRLTVEY